MTNILSSRLIRFAAIILAIVALSLAGMKLFTLRSYDRDNARSLVNSYLMSHEVLIDRTPEQVFSFITNDMSRHNLGMAEAHSHFSFLKGDAIAEGAVFVAEEYQENEGVKNTYTVEKIIPNRLIYYASEPTLIYSKKDGRWEETGYCNAYVYFDIEAYQGKSAVTQTLVIQMPNFLYKFIIDLLVSTSEDNQWHKHLVEELESVKMIMEST